MTAPLLHATKGWSRGKAPRCSPMQPRAGRAECRRAARPCSQGLVARNVAALLAHAAKGGYKNEQVITNGDDKLLQSIRVYFSRQLNLRRLGKHMGLRTARFKAEEQHQGRMAVFFHTKRTEQLRA
jgi:hypothetical protein